MNKMIGNNELRLNLATMFEALNEWAEKHLTDKVNIVGVEQQTSGYDVTFVVKIEAK